MNLKLGLQTLFVSLLAALPGAYLGFYIYSQWSDCEGAYEAMGASLKPKASKSNLQARPHEREGIIKQIWFRPLENGTSLYLQAGSSKLVVESVEGRLHAKEKLYHVFAGFQDRATNHPTSDQGYPWLLRLLRAQSADFDYSLQSLEAGKVDVEIYQLAEAYDLARLGAPSKSLATLRGSAESIHLDCKTSPPHFKAKRFRAFVNPQAQGSSS